MPEPGLSPLCCSAASYVGTQFASLSGGLIRLSLRKEPEPVSRKITLPVLLQHPERLKAYVNPQETSIFLSMFLRVLAL